ncbi:aldehyde reductase [Fulvivirga imtechensis AK7]|uniref:Aldehyde reductase n=1 Tax=Fulvivirga imtechensis AK7 TaxID=1237149 RepID=L8JJ18_9BACT|nr:aldehyde reductase [Fulvivirga imtechensis AK7]
MEPALKKTLNDLQIDYLDLYLIHWPVALKKGTQLARSAEDFIPLNDIPTEETWKAMEDMLNRKLTRHIGVCNFGIGRLDGLMKSATIKPEVNQIELHPYLQQNNMLEFSRKNNVHVTAYSPLGSADRPDSLKVKDEPSLLDDQTIAEIATKHKATLRRC